MSDFLWNILRIGGYLAIGLISLIVSLITAMLALFGTWLVIDWRRQRALARQSDEENATLHDRIQAYLRQQLTAQE